MERVREVRGERGKRRGRENEMKKGEREEKGVRERGRCT